MVIETIDIKDKVSFRRPNFKEIKRHGFTAVDMHIHTNYSDGMSKLKTVLKKAKKLGIGISITDHNEIKGNLEAAKDYDFVIPAIEVTTLEWKDFLIYFYNQSELIEFYEKEIKNFRYVTPLFRIKKKMADVFEKLDRYNGIVVAAHPIGYVWKNLYKLMEKDKELKERMMKKIQGIEVINGEVPRLRNKKALRWTKELGKMYTGGSDAHSVIQVGRVVTYSDAEFGDVEGFLDNIRKKRNFVVGKELKKIGYMLTHPHFLLNYGKHVGNGVKKLYMDKRDKLKS